LVADGNARDVAAGRRHDPRDIAAERDRRPQRRYELELALADLEVDRVEARRAHLDEHIAATDDRLVAVDDRQRIEPTEPLRDHRLHRADCIVARRQADVETLELVTGSRRTCTA